MLWLLGVAAFFLFFVYDACERRPHRTWMSFLFPAGCLLFLVAVIGQLAPFSPSLPPPGVRLLFGLLGMGAFFLLIKALFFSFPKEEGYTHTGEKRPVDGPAAVLPWAQYGASPVDGGALQYVKSFFGPV